MDDTAATRVPAMTIGTAIGSSTRRRRRSGPKPMAVAACRTGSDTDASPSTTFGTSTDRLYSVSGIMTVDAVSPVYWMKIMNSASDGIA